MTDLLQNSGLAFRTTNDYNNSLPESKIVRIFYSEDIKHINIYTTYEYPYLISLYGNAILYIESTTIKKSGSHLVFFVSGPSFSSFESSSLYLGEGNKFIVPNMPISWLPYPGPKSFVKGLGHVEEITYRSKTVQNEEKTKP